MNYQGKNIFYTTIAGSLGGMSALTITYPTEYVKTLLQLSTNKLGFYELFKNQVKSQGFFKLYRGYLPTLFSILPRSGINFMTYEYVSYKIKNENDSRLIAMGKNLFSGMTAGAVSSSLLSTPIENIKTGMIYYQGKGEIKKPTEIIQKLGLKRIFTNGSVPTILKESTTYGVRFFIYTECLSILNKRENVSKIEKGMNIMISSIISGSISCIINNPLDVVQTRIQTPNHNETSMIKNMKSIIKNEGVKTLYKGCFIRVIRTTPAVCVSFGVYELVCSLLF